MRKLLEFRVLITKDIQSPELAFSEAAIILTDWNSVAWRRPTFTKGLEVFPSEDALTAFLADEAIIWARGWLQNHFFTTLTPEQYRMVDDNAFDLTEIDRNHIFDLCITGKIESQLREVAMRTQSTSVSEFFGPILKLPKY